MFTFTTDDAYLAKAISEFIISFNIEKEATNTPEPSDLSRHELVRLRKEANLSQAELANLTGIHSVTISRIESGVQAKPRSKTMIQLIRTCKIAIGQNQHSTPTS